MAIAKPCRGGGGGGGGGVKAWNLQNRDCWSLCVKL